MSETSTGAVANVQLPEVNDDVNAPIKIDPKKKAEVEQLAAQINLGDVTSIQSIGEKLHAELSEFNSKILSKAKMAEVDNIDGIITDVVLKANSLDPATINKNPGIFGRLFGKAKSGLEQFKMRQETVEQYFNKIQEKLVEDIEQARDDSRSLDSLFEINYQEFQKLDILIAACEQRHQQAMEVELPKLIEDAKDGDPFKMQQVGHLKNTLTILEKKIFYLRCTRMDGLQNSVLIRNMQNSALVAIETNVNLINGALNQWKKGYAIILVQNRQKGMSERAKAVSDAANAIKLRNAQMLEQNSIQIAKNNENAGISCEVLQTTNETLIRTMDAVAKIQAEAKQKRIEDSKKLVEMEKQLKDRVVQANNTIH